AAPAAPQHDMVEQLRRLGELRDAGILTEEEFAAQKAKVLGS
ncbi:MAG: SHOCT domain-containing protein, partial [Actinomycetota bacterium]|nr:SHOCT domain-containing protein [Actinomycetota bacterium]